MKTYWRNSRDIDGSKIDPQVLFVPISETLMLNCCLMDDSMMEHWWNTEDFVFNLCDHWCVFIVLICETLMYLDASVMIVWCFFEGSFLKQRCFWCKHYWSLPLFLRYIPKYWWFLAASLMVRWNNIHETLATPF